MTDLPHLTEMLLVFIQYCKLFCTISLTFDLLQGMNENAYSHTRTATYVCMYICTSKKHVYVYMYEIK